MRGKNKKNKREYRQHIELEREWEAAHMSIKKRKRDYIFKVNNEMSRVSIG